MPELPGLVESSLPHPGSACALTLHPHCIPSAARLPSPATTLFVYFVRPFSSC